MKSLCILAAALLLSTAYAGQTVSIKDAENVAVRYMTAFYSVEMEKVADLAHPQTLNAFHKIFNQEFEKAIQTGSEKEFLAKSGLNIDSSKLKSMSARDLFIYVVTSNNMRAPEKHRELMKQTKITVLKSEMTNSESAKVLLRFINPGGSPSGHTGGLLLRIYKGQWKVVSETAGYEK